MANSYMNLQQCQGVSVLDQCNCCTFNCVHRSHSKWHTLNARDPHCSIKETFMIIDGPKTHRVFRRKKKLLSGGFIASYIRHI